MSDVRSNIRKGSGSRPKLAALARIGIARSDSLISKQALDTETITFLSESRSISDLDFGVDKGLHYMPSYAASVAAASRQR